MEDLEKTKAELLTILSFGDYFADLCDLVDKRWRPVGVDNALWYILLAMSKLGLHQEMSPIEFYTVALNGSIHLTSGTKEAASISSWLVGVQTWLHVSRHTALEELRPSNN